MEPILATSVFKDIYVTLPGKSFTQSELNSNISALEPCRLIFTGRWFKALDKPTTPFSILVNIKCLGAIYKKSFQLPPDSDNIPFSHSFSELMGGILDVSVTADRSVILKDLKILLIE